MPLNKTYIFSEDLYLSVGRSKVYLRSGQGVEWCLEKAVTRQPWILRIYRSCLAGDLLFAAFTATTVNLTRPNLLPLSFSVHLSFSEAVFQHFSLPLMSLFVFLCFFFCFFCLIMTVHHNALLSGNCHSHYLFNLSLHVCQILKCITALQNINCLLSINRLARRSQAEIQLCLCSVWVKCGAGYHRIWIIHACSGSVRVF